MRRFGCVCVVVSLFVLPCAALAQDAGSCQLPAASSPPVDGARGCPERAEGQLPVAGIQLPVASSQLRTASSRPHALLPLYAAFAGAQAADYVLTVRALSSGTGREANPLMAGVAGNRAAFVAVKAASTAGILLVSEKLWKKNRVGAVVMMLVADGVMGAVVAHNARVR